MAEGAEHRELRRGNGLGTPEDLKAAPVGWDRRQQDWLEPKE